MIDKNVIVEYLDPSMWKNLVSIIEIINPKPEILYVLDEEKSYRMVFHGEAHIWEKTQEVSVEKLWDKYPNADEVRIYTYESINSFYKDVQKNEIGQMDIDEYLEFLYQKLQMNIRIIYRENKQGNLWRILAAWNNEEGVHNIGINRNGVLYFQCILEFEGGKLRRITTSDRYGKDVYNWEKICKNVEEEFSGKIFHTSMELAELKEKYYQI